MIVSDAKVFQGIAGDGNTHSCFQSERRRSFRRPLGTIATIARVIDGQEHNRLHVLVTNRSHEGVGLRSPIGLPTGGVYRVRIGSDPAEGITIQVSISRRRHDETFDIGATCL